MLCSPMVLLGADLVRGGSREQVVRFLNQQSNYHFTQHPDWASAQNIKNFIGVGTRREGRLVAWSLIEMRRLPVIRLVKYFGGRGPVLHDSAALAPHIADLTQLLSAEGLYLMIHPYVFGPNAQCLESELNIAGFESTGDYERYYRDTLTIDLTESLEDIRAGFRKSVIRQIKKSTKLGVEVVEVISDSERQQFVTDYSVAMKAKNLGTPGNFPSLLAKVAMSPAGFSLQALWQGRRVAGIALVGSGTNIIYEWGYTSSQPGHRSLPLHHALHWQAIQRAKMEGYTTYDLGGYWSELGDSNPVNRFKLGLSHNQCHGCGPLVLSWRPRISRLVSWSWR